jgi:hypothetical protein
MSSAQGRQADVTLANWDLGGGALGLGLPACGRAARDLVIAFAGMPRADGSVNLLRWYSRHLARSIR